MDRMISGYGRLRQKALLGTQPRKSTRRKEEATHGLVIEEGGDVEGSKPIQLSLLNKVPQEICDQDTV